jgi:hypothetical protein
LVRIRGEGRGGRRGPRLNLRLFRAEILLYELVYKLNQDLIGPAIRVLEQVYRDVPIAEL